MNVDVGYMSSMTNKPDRIRNVAIVGPFHSGKTLLMDMLVRHTHKQKWDLGDDLRYTDARKDEREREMSVKATPMTMLLADSREKSHYVNIMDTPGHPNFVEEVAVSL